MRVRRGSAGLKLDSYECLVELRPTGSKPPLFLVCWGGGKLIGYRDLIERLPKDLPVYGLRAPRFDGRRNLYPTLQELARLFLAEVRRFRPEPPYLFAGYCFGGTRAHEMASQLEADGETTAFLGLIESAPYGHAEFKATQWPKRIERERTFVKTLADNGLRGKASLMATRFLGHGNWVSRKFRRVAYRTVRRTGWAWPRHLGNLEQAAIYTALDRYVAPSSNAHVTLIKACAPAQDLKEPTVWLRLAGQVEVLPIMAAGVGHVSIMHEPYVTQLADQLGQRVDTALRRTEPGWAKQVGVGSM